MRIGPPRPPRGGPEEAIAQRLEGWADPVSGRTLEVLEDAQGAYWIVDPSIGEVRIPGPIGQIEIWSAPTVEPARFMETLFYQWLRPIYGIWGWQVLPASAVVRTSSNSAIAFAGPAASGKSTLAYAVGSQPGWCQLTDDALALTDPDYDLRLIPIPNRVRLASPAADRLGFDSETRIDLEWPSVEPKLEALYILTPSERSTESAEITPVRLSDAWPALLGPAAALSLPTSRLRSELSVAIRELVAGVRIFRLTYSQDLERLPTLVRGISLDALKVIGQAESLRQGDHVQAAPMHVRLRSAYDSPA